VELFRCCCFDSRLEMEVRIFQEIVEQLNSSEEATTKKGLEEETSSFHQLMTVEEVVEEMKTFFSLLLKKVCNKRKFTNTKALFFYCIFPRKRKFRLANKMTKSFFIFIFLFKFYYFFLTLLTTSNHSNTIANPMLATNA
jgi:hypothetical protein